MPGLYAQSTNIDISTQPIQNGVKRLGINLGGVNYWDSGQILKNLTFGNPGFEPTIWHSTVQCSGGSTTSCVDQNVWTGWTTGYWPAGSSVQVISGAASGCSTTVSSYTNPGGGVGGTFAFASACGGAISAGDYIIVEQTIDSKINPAFGYWPSTTGNGNFSIETYDLPPGTTGVQALQVTAPTAADSCSLSSFFDADASGRSFVNLNGTYQISFAAKGISGSQKVKVSFFRGGTTYVSQIVSLTSSWANYTVNFSASETGAQTGNAQLNFLTVGADTFFLDNISTVQTGTNSNNPTVFRDSVVTTLQTLNPGIIRMWDGAGLGNTLDNMLIDQFGRQPSNYSAYYQNYYNTISYSIPEFLQLVQTVGNGAEPWIALPITFTPAEASNLIDYLSGDASTVYGAKRIAQGFSKPWTQVFPTIHLEFGNEAWNSTFGGGSIQEPNVYGARAQTIFAAMKGNQRYDAAHTSLVLGGFFASSYYVQQTQNNCNNNDEIDVAPYMMNNPTDASSAANLFQPTLAEPQAYYASGSLFPGVTAEGINAGWFNLGGVAQVVNGGGMYLDLAAEANSNHPVPVSIYEENLSTTGGSMSQSQLDTFASSMGAGLATVSEELVGIQNGVINQNVFALTQFHFFRPDGETVRLWGTVVDMGGPTNLRRPQFLAEQLANAAISTGGSMLKTVQSGSNPTWNQSLDNTVAMNGVNYIQSFAFNGANGPSIVLLNLSLTDSLPVTFSGSNAPQDTVQLQQLTSSSPSDTNEDSSRVNIAYNTLTGFTPSSGITLPPYSITVLSWNGSSTAGHTPVISSVSVSGISSSSATITWTTDQPSSSQVQYGTTPSYGSYSQLNSTMSASHSVTLTGLTPGTAYNFDAISANSSGTSATSPNFTFTTLTQAPVISAVSVGGITSSSATITWTTDQPTNSQILFGTTSNYGSASTLNYSLTTSHSVTLTGLSAGTTYNFAAWSANASGSSAISPNLTFTTLSNPPVISAVAAGSFSSTSAVITWTTDQASSSQVRYGTTTGYGSSASSSTLSTAHSVTITGLTAGTLYNYAVSSSNSAGNSASSANFTFSTLAQAPVISAVSVSSVTTSSAVIAWTTDQISSSQVQYGTSSAYGSSSAVNSTLSTLHIVTLTGLTQGTTYNFAVKSVNPSGNSATSGNYTLTTLTQAPVISAVNASVSGNTAAITWTTDQASSSQVQFGTTAAYGSAGPGNTTMTTSHSVTLTGLSAGTTYDFAVTSVNSAGLSATSSNFTFATTAVNTPVTSPGPAIIHVAYWGITSSGITISWATDVRSTTAVAYGTTPALGQMSPVQTSLSNSHGAVLTGLNSGTTYYFAAQSTDANGNVGYSTIYSFTTITTAAPTISNVTPNPQSGNQATVSWTTSVPTYSYIVFGPTSAYGHWSTRTGLTATPQLSLGWVSSGVVHFQIVSSDNYGNQTVSPDYTFVEP